MKNKVVACTLGVLVGQAIIYGVMTYFDVPEPIKYLSMASGLCTGLLSLLM